MSRNFGPYQEHHSPHRVFLRDAVFTYGIPYSHAHQKLALDLPEILDTIAHLRAFENKNPAFPALYQTGKVVNN